MSPICPMLVYILTAAVPRTRCAPCSPGHVSFNCIPSTGHQHVGHAVAFHRSVPVRILASSNPPEPCAATWQKRRAQWRCSSRHRVRWRRSTPELAAARQGDVNAPLFRRCRNDPNVGRLIQHRSHVGQTGLDLTRSARIAHRILPRRFSTRSEKEVALSSISRKQSLPSAPPKTGCSSAGITQHERCVEIEVDLGSAMRAPRARRRFHPRIRERKRGLSQLGARRFVLRAPCQMAGAIWTDLCIAVEINPTVAKRELPRSFAHRCVDAPTQSIWIRLATARTSRSHLVVRPGVGPCLTGHMASAIGWPRM